MNVYVDKNGLAHLRKSKNRFYVGQLGMKVAADFAKEVNSDMTRLALVRYVGKEPKMEVCEIEIEEVKP